MRRYSYLRPSVFIRGYIPQINVDTALVLCQL